MRRIISAFSLIAIFTITLPAAEIEGVIADWNCTQTMVQNGREKVLKQRRACSLMKKFRRGAYGLITEDKKFYKLQDPGNRHILQLLKNTPDKDNLKVVVTGTVNGDTIQVTNITML